MRPPHTGSSNTGRPASYMCISFPWQKQRFRHKVLSAWSWCPNILLFLLPPLGPLVGWHRGHVLGSSKQRLTPTSPQKLETLRTRLFFQFDPKCSETLERHDISHVKKCLFYFGFTFEQKTLFWSRRQPVWALTANSPFFEDILLATGRTKDLWFQMGELGICVNSPPVSSTILRSQSPKRRNTMDPA